MSIPSKRRPTHRAAFESLESRVLMNAGDLDMSFSSDGKAMIALGGGGILQAADVAVQSDGKVIVVGGCFGGALSGKLIVARLNTDGNLDTTFGGAGTGIASTDFGEGGVQTKAVAVQPADDKIVVVGSQDLDTIGFCGVARFTSGGLIDTSFSGDGKDVISNFDENTLAGR
jgi:uncharacterized delta-60 repeat protein